MIPIPPSSLGVSTSNPHNAGEPPYTPTASAAPTVPQDLQLVSDLDEFHAGWCAPIGGCFVNTIASAPVGRNFAAFAADLGSFLLHRPRRRLGAVANSRTSQPCMPARSPLPVLEIHGGSDTDMPYAGGAGEGGTGAIPDCSLLCGEVILSTTYTTWWAARNGCTAANTTETPFDGDVHHPSWACAEGESVLQHWKVDDMRELLTSSLVSCFVFCLNPTLISYHSTLFPPLLTDLLPLLVPCVSLRPILPALPIFLRIVVPKLLTRTSHSGPSFYHCLPSFLPPSCFPIPSPDLTNSVPLLLLYASLR
ncbi:hypothetical protein B0H14DRAFT_3444774 [Mycena olivaceomarginata]|nr:hypothetical protein B0H14DRAFT_3444774 [Mycena olivaceomarginata]